MAIVRTVLPRKGLVQSQHGLTQYEQDQDGNWSLLDSNIAFMSDLVQSVNQQPNQVFAGPASGAAAAPAFRALALADLPLAALLPLTVMGAVGINGVASGFALSTSSSFTPGLTAGVLFAQGIVYAPSAAPAVPAAPASATSYLFYNSTSGFYWQASPVGAHAGDALIGSATTSGTAVTTVAQATKIFGQVALAPGAAGNFTVAHMLGRAPVGASLLLTSTTLIVWQATPWDGTNLYLNAAGASSGIMILW